MTLNEKTYEDDYKDTCTKLIFSNIIFFWGGGAKSNQDQLIIAMPDTGGKTCVHATYRYF